MKPDVTRRSFLKSAAAGAALSALPGCLSAIPRRKARKPNIIFILADDLGYAELGCCGQKKIRTPNIDRLAAEGMRFAQNYSGSTFCAPSRCVLLTGSTRGTPSSGTTANCPPRGSSPFCPGRRPSAGCSGRRATQRA